MSRTATSLRATTPPSHARKRRLTQRHSHADNGQHQGECRLLPPESDSRDDRRNSDRSTHGRPSSLGRPLHSSSRRPPCQHAAFENPQVAHACLTKDRVGCARTHTRTTDDDDRLPGRRQLLRFLTQLVEGHVARAGDVAGGEFRRGANIEQSQTVSTLDALPESSRPDSHLTGSPASRATWRGVQPNAPARPSMRSSGQNPVKLD